MRIPKSLESLADQGVIQEVLRPLMSGKEAQIYLVVSEDHYCAAKIYKDAQNRSFKNKADYTEGRKVRNSRDQRAIEKGSKYGKDKDEDTWKATEVEMIYRLRDAGVRVPEPFVYIDGVLLMELVVDEHDNPAPRLGDLEFSPAEATEIYQHLIHETAKMLCAGVVHGDLSDFNVLLGADGPVIIDFPQSVNAASNQGARTLLLRDVNNLHRFLQRWVPGARRLPYAEEMWALYENNGLTPDTRLTGKYKGSSGPVDTRAVMSLIGDANRDEVRRRQAQGKSTADITRREDPTPGPNAAGPNAAGPNAAGPNSTAPSAAGPNAAVPARRREYVVEKPAPRARPPQDRPPHNRPRDDRAPQNRAPHDRPRDDRAPHDRAPHDRAPQNGARDGRPPQGRPPQGRPFPDRPGNAAAARPDRARSDPRRPGPGQRPGQSAMPKRGDAVQGSTYVSPEARKAKVKALTPRDGSGAPRQNSGESKDANSTREGGPRRERFRRNRGSASSNTSSSSTTSSPRATTSPHPVERKPQQSSHAPTAKRENDAPREASPGGRRRRPRHRSSD